MTVLVHLSDLHFGRDADLDQIRALEALIPSLGPAAIVVSGDLTQRARHGELQRARVFIDQMAKTAPVHAVPGNHDVQWWESPLHLLGRERIYAKYRRYFGHDLSPTSTIPGVTIASALTSHGVAFGSLTWKLWRDTAVKGHLPAEEVARVAQLFETRSPADCRVVVTHHNVLRGQISQRMGLAHWREAQRSLAGSGADLVLCGHDHQEAVGMLDGAVVVATASTHTHRTRGHRPSAFNVIAITQATIAVHHQCWNQGAARFEPTEPIAFARRIR